MRWRRCVSVPLYLALWALALAATPVALPLAAGVDGLRRSRWVAVRSGALLVTYLTCEAVGLLAAVGTWAWSVVARPDRVRRDDVHFRLEAAWGTALFRSAATLFGLRLEVTGAEEAQLGRGPYLLFVRHASTGDTVLASAIVARPHRMHLRYVLKRELLWDPCLDVVGGRLPNAFVDRFSDDSPGEIERVRNLARDLGPRDGVLLYPEGTRFSEAKRERVLTRLAASGDAKRLEAARSLRAVLPPRRGGALALLEAAPDADVVVCAHTGFEGAASLAELWRGELVGRTVRVGFWRVPRATIPRDAPERAAWLLDEWRRVDDWVLRHRQHGDGGP